MSGTFANFAQVLCYDNCKIAFLWYKSRMKRIKTIKIACQLLWIAASMTACRPAYEVTAVEGHRVPIDSTWDNRIDAEARVLIAPYRKSLDSLCNRVVGQSALAMTASRPESPLSNLVADILRQAAVQSGGTPADIGLVNFGALRKGLPQGIITGMDIYEMLPFDDNLCLLALKGIYVKQLFENIAACGGEGISGAQLAMSPTGRLLEARVGGHPIDDERLYTIATIDYLAGGNGGMLALLQAESCVNIEGQTLQGIFTRYVARQHAAGRSITSRMDGRITIKPWIE